MKSQVFLLYFILSIKLNVVFSKFEYKLSWLIFENFPLIFHLFYAFSYKQKKKLNIKNMQQMCSINDINYKLLDKILFYFLSKEKQFFFCYILDLFFRIIIFPLNKSFLYNFLEKSLLFCLYRIVGFCFNKKIKSKIIYGSFGWIRKIFLK